MMDSLEGDDAVYKRLDVRLSTKECKRERKEVVI